MTRNQDWERLLRGYLTSTFSWQFKYGQADCCVFVINWIRLCTGEDVFGDFRDKYDSADTATVVLKAVTGQPTVEAAAVYVTQKHSMPEVPVLMARRGDVVYMQEGDRLGLVHLNGREAVFLLQTGWKTFPVAQCQRAWRV